jgi:hypothetical protein
VSLSLVVTPALLKAALLVSTATAVGAAGHAVATDDTAFARLFARYVRHLDEEHRLLFRQEVGRRIAIGQAALLGATVLAGGCRRCSLRSALGSICAASGSSASRA